MRKPRWFDDSILDRAVRHAPRRYWVGWGACLAYVAATLAYSHFVVGGSFLLGVLALGMIAGIGVMLAWTIIH